MRESLERICENFIHNRDTIKASFKWDSKYIIAVCASDLCGKNTVVNADKLEQCKRIVNDKTGIFSNFRGNVKLPIITMLAEADNPEEKFDKTMKIYKILKEYFGGSEYLSFVAAILADMVTVDTAEAYIARGKRIHGLMKEEHPFLTSGEDSVFAVLMAFSDKNDEELIIDMEACYKIMKKQFSNGNAVQSLSHILSLSQGTSEEKCQSVFSMYQGLKNEGKNYGKNYELSVLGSLSMMSSDMNAMIEDIISVDNFLEKQKGYGSFGIDRKTRLMHAVMLTACDYSQESNISTAAITGTMAMIAAQQAAMCAVIAASAAASAN